MTAPAAARSYLQVAPNLALDEAVQARRRAGEPLLHLGFGEAGLPVFPGLLDALAAGAASNAYGPVGGWRDARAAVAGYFERRGLPTHPDQIVLAPGSKPLLAALVAAEPGDVVLPAPSWVTYAPQAHLFDRRVIWSDIPAEAGGVPDPDTLAATLAAARADGANPRLMVLTLPDNPTGTLASDATIRRLCAIAEDEDLVVVSDEIYRDVVFDLEAPYLSPAKVAPDRTVVMTGLSKSLALGGWRIGAARTPDTAWGAATRERLVAVASQVWSNLAAPMQSVVEYAFNEPAELVAHRTASTRLHAVVARAVHEVFDRHGLAGRAPTGAFYVYPDLEPLRERLAGVGVHGSADLDLWLLREHGLAVLGGHAFGDDPRALRFRAATSLLYGDTADERWATLRAGDPLQAPPVAAALSRLDGILTAVTST